jgi:hypothetical protein
MPIGLSALGIAWLFSFSTVGVIIMCVLASLISGVVGYRLSERDTE